MIRVGVSRAALAVAFAAAAIGASAATVETFSLQGEVKGVRQVAARFSAQMVPFGDLRFIEPFDVACPEKGTGRWADGRNWVYDFARVLPAGVACTFTVKSGLTTLAGEAVAPGAFAFTTGGPAIRRALPYEGAAIDENQVFILALDAPTCRSPSRRTRSPDGAACRWRCARGSRRSSTASGST